MINQIKIHGEIENKKVVKTYYLYNSIFYIPKIEILHQKIIS